MEKIDRLLGITHEFEFAKRFSVTNVLFTFSDAGLIIVNRSKSKESMQRSECEGSVRKLKKITSNDPTKELSPLEQINDVHKKLIEQIVTNQEKFEVPSDDDLITFTV